MSEVRTVTLTEFLTARLDEDEAVAKAASPSPWQYGTVESVAGGSLYDATRMIGALHYEQLNDHDGTTVRHLLSREANANGAHIERHDPARVLAEVEAKRQIVEETRFSDDPQSEVDWWMEPSRRGLAPGARVAALTGVLKCLALPYADHPDYREEWKP